MGTYSTGARPRPLPQQIYKHFKGNIYQINCIAVDSEDGKECVVYQALYGDYRYYVRPLDMFMSEVDHEKYPDVTQKYRFELICPGESSQVPPAGTQQSPVPTARDLTPEAVVTPSAGTSSEDESVSLDPDLEAFLDADSCEQRLEILSHMHYKIDDDMIDIMSTSIDIEIPAGRTSDRYEKLKDALMLRRKFETGRLR